MSDVLARICADKRAELDRRMAARPLAEVREAAARVPRPRGFTARLDAAVAAGGYGLVAEIKKRSPSRGLIRADFEPAALAAAYARGGASCLSVLTDTAYFGGTDACLQAARAATRLPVLRKDFMLDPYQIVEARAIGADCVLLILAVLCDQDATALEDTALALGMDVLIEVHDEAELARALALRSPLIGINNRDLKTLTVDLGTTERLADRVPADRTVVCESGLSTPQDLARMARAGVHRFLIGEALMAEADVEAATRALLGSPAPAHARA